MSHNRGVLYVVATPIGNMKDITLRALEVLKESNFILCEDTRKTMKIMSHYNISGPKLLTYNEHNENKRIPEVLKLLREGNTISLVCNAGTPTIQDPGYRLIKVLKEEGFKVLPVPGPSALIAALSVSGLPTNRFIFFGFLPRKKGKRESIYKEWIEDEMTVIFYESPKRIKEIFKEIKSYREFENRRVFIAREMTKKFESYAYLLIKDVDVEDLLEKGEYVVILEGKK